MSGPITGTDEVRLSPSLRTRRLHLRMLTNEDHAPLYRLSSDPDVTFQWRFRGTTPSYDEFLKQLYPGVLCQFVVSPHGSQEVWAWSSPTTPTSDTGSATQPWSCTHACTAAAWG